ncbi:hypothetical protein HUG10_10530 [Halorarum halophilum]|uniref:Sugar lactone lactonase YvrE n=1 Tax=Halorarum halophilum TaxID=2743090 RepID=A0A7D5GC81_9EURY|nr:hypothetical protein [Halobaculum halophilum]QLG27965.1 hypothetical protein HUG10_10530 [Halobaculum halophilum]
MTPISRRAFGRLLGTTAGFGLAGVTGADPGDGGRRRGQDGSDAVETFVSMPGERTPENLAIGPGGDLFFGVTDGQVRRVARETAASATDLTLADTDLIGEPPAAAGVEATPEGPLYVAVNADGVPSGVWTVPLDGGEPRPYATVSGQFTNDIVYDPGRDRLLVTESFAGAVYEVPVGEGGVPVDDAEATEWLDAGVLDTESFGANGLTFRGADELLVAVTRATDGEGADVGRLVRVQIRDDGAAGEPELFLESPAIFGADGITVRGEQVYVAANGRNEVVRVTTAGESAVVADADDGLVFPSDVVFGAGSGGSADLFVCNFATTDPGSAGILRTRP